MTQPSATSTPPQPSYVAPQVKSLGNWEVVTLAQSVPIGPGSFGLPNPFDATAESW
ncbi:hypothetical protein K7W42_15330 [Deinococcus sp. HMF7604]|uniref:hypothetical protein n=1 Tax=Deinococcus betulae TaxID=2873312 RepID=UPI001CCA6CA5|nr:hypothetical protein [Deinococcus betulae]MBZ9752226.1 hypothetical protein [Deinococcus betulae]